ncbi:MAG: LamG-like jellyroll fold domain-containing protein [Saprospiraceae bacterium]
MKTIKFFLYFLVMAFTLSFVSSCGDDEEDLPAIGGYNNADEVGASSLLAYWPMDGNGTESISNTPSSSSTGVSFVDGGVKGKAASFAEGYLAYPSIAALTSMSDATVSMWIKISNNGSTPSMFFQMTREDSETAYAWAGNINVMAETGWRAATNDSVTVKGYVQIKKDDGGVNGQDIINSINPNAAALEAGSFAAPNKIGGTGEWAHLVWTWDSTKGAHYLYVNGVKISDPRWEVRNGGDPLALNFFTPTTPLIGTFGSVIKGTPDSWQKSLTGEIDELRVWNKTLSSADINSLYELEKAGR